MRLMNIESEYFEIGGQHFGIVWLRRDDLGWVVLRRDPEGRMLPTGPTHATREDAWTFAQELADTEAPF